MTWTDVKSDYVENDNDSCAGCGKDLGVKIPRCCSGRECNCMGMPVDPNVCSDECLKKVYPWHWEATVGKKYGSEKL